MLVKSANKPHLDVSSLVNYVGQQEKPTDFGEIMIRAASRTSENQKMPNRENLNKASAFVTNPAQAERPKNNLTKSSETEAEKAEAPKELKESNQTKTESLQESKPVNDQITEKTEEMAEATKAADEILNIIAAKFDITPEEVIEVLATLGLIPESLLDPAILSEAAVALEGTDLLTLMTDEVLYENFTGLTSEVQPIIDELLETTDLTPEEMKLLINKLQTMEKGEVAPDKLTESVNQVNELAEQQLNEPEQKVTIVIEKDGVITEVTAKADENGNLKATTDVAEISTEPIVTVETQEQSGQSGNQNSERNTEGHEAILNNLLQNRINSVEAKFEPIIMETPDTGQIMNQILDYMKVKLTPEINSLEMQLHPASLGTVGVKITSTAGVITAQFTAQNETVRAAIESQIVELKESMRSQGIKVEAIEVNIESKAFDSKLWQGKEEHQSGEQGERKNRRRINLAGLNELPEDLAGDEKLAAEMMIENGQTVDFSA